MSETEHRATSRRGLTAALHNRLSRFGRLARLPLAGWLFVGWCLLAVAWFFGMYGRIFVCPYGQRPCRQLGSALRHGWSQAMLPATVAVLGAAALGLLWWWDRRAGAIAGTDVAPVRRWRPLAAVLASLAGVLAGAHLMLFAPMVDDPYCATTTRLNDAMAYPLNCDSPAFLQLAHHPTQILQPNDPRQSRPGYIALGAGLTRLVGPVANATGLTRWYGQSDSAYIPLVLINLLLVTIAVTLLGWLLNRLQAPRWAIVALCAMVVVNDVTKPFVWTPHQQMFALLVPVLTITLGRWVILTRPSWWALAVAGLGVGAVSLCYGSVLITVAAVTLILLGTRRWRGVPLAAVFGAAFTLPTLSWIAVCNAVAGSYYNRELKLYHEFVWPKDAWHDGGLHTLRVWVHTMNVKTAQELFSIGGTALALLILLAVAAVLFRARLATTSAEHRAILIPAGMTAVGAVAFCWSIGIFAERLMYHLVPALFVLAGWLVGRLHRTNSRSQLAAMLILGSTTAAAVTTTLTQHGPYS